MKKIIVIGSSNVDMVVRTSHLPAPVRRFWREFFMEQGGKEQSGCCNKEIGRQSDIYGKIGE